MRIAIRGILLAIFVLTMSGDANTQVVGIDGIFSQGAAVGIDGIINAGAGSVIPPPVGCSTMSLDFSNSCDLVLMMTVM